MSCLLTIIIYFVLFAFISCSSKPILLKTVLVIASIKAVTVFSIVLGFQLLTLTVGTKDIRKAYNTVDLF